MEKVSPIVSMLPISYTTYKQFAKLYHIPLTHVREGARKRKSIKELRKQIKSHEHTHDVRGGLYV